MSDQRHHVAALDAVRGLAIAAMILVNNPGDWNSVFAPLQHSEWNGWTFADVVFPFFVFIMGCAMPFAFARRQARHGDDWRAGMRVLRRAVLLIALGLVLNLEIAAPHVSALRIPGVLQRLALAYLGAALIVRSTRPLRQAAIAGVLLLGYWALLTLVPFGGMPPPADLTHDRNLAGFIDAAVFGSHTLMPGFDPEGLLGTLPTIATALLGALAGQWLRHHHDRWRQIAGLSVAGVLLAAAGLVWSVVWPINKPLWTGSYALLMSGIAAITLAMTVWVMDVMDVRAWAKPFLALGVNPLAIYFGSEFVGHLLEPNKHVIYWGVFARWSDGGELASLLFAVVYVGCWLAVAVILDRRHIRIRV